MSHLIKSNKTKKAYSLVEVLVSMAIIAIVMVMFSDVLVTSIRTSIKISARSSIREEMSAIGSMIRKDIRTADKIIDCAETVPKAGVNQCHIYVNNADVQWIACSYDPTKLCRIANGTVMFESPKFFKLTYLEFSPGIETDANTQQRNILLTIAADYNNTDLGINNLIYQTTLSSRNYLIIRLN